MADDDDDVCPLCVEPFETADKCFMPCSCGFEICMFCWKKIKETGNGCCPACRHQFTQEPMLRPGMRMEDVMRQQVKVKVPREVKKQPPPIAAPATVKAVAKSAVSHAKLSKTQLQNVRVVQRNLVYIIGLTSGLAKEATLKSSSYFGQYGRIIKVVVSKDGSGAGGADASRSASFSAFITFSREVEARAAIFATDGFYVDARCIRCCFGTTKYCHAWLRDEACTTGECLYLHEAGAPEDSFSRDEMLGPVNSFGLNFSELVHPNWSLRNANGVVGGQGNTTPGTTPTSCAGAMAAAKLKGTVLPPLPAELVPTVVNRAPPPPQFAINERRGKKGEKSKDGAKVSVKPAGGSKAEATPPPVSYSPVHDSDADAVGMPSAEETATDAGAGRLYGSAVPNSREATSGSAHVDKEASSWPALPGKPAAVAIMPLKPIPMASKGDVGKPMEGATGGAAAAPVRHGAAVSAAGLEIHVTPVVSGKGGATKAKGGQPLKVQGQVQGKGKAQAISKLTSHPVSIPDHSPIDPDYDSGFDDEDGNGTAGFEEGGGARGGGSVGASGTASTRSSRRAEKLKAKRQAKKDTRVAEKAGAGGEAGAKAAKAQRAPAPASHKLELGVGDGLEGLLGIGLPLSRQGHAVPMFSEGLPILGDSLGMPLLSALQEDHMVNGFNVSSRPFVPSVLPVQSASVMSATMGASLGAGTETGSLQGSGNGGQLAGSSVGGLGGLGGFGLGINSLGGGLFGSGPHLGSSGLSSFGKGAGVSGSSLLPASIEQLLRLGGTEHGQGGSMRKAASQSEGGYYQQQQQSRPIGLGTDFSGNLMSAGPFSDSFGVSAGVQGFSGFGAGAGAGMLGTQRSAGPAPPSAHASTWLAGLGGLGNGLPAGGLQVGGEPPVSKAGGGQGVGRSTPAPIKISVEALFGFQGAGQPQQQQQQQEVYRQQQQQAQMYQLQMKQAQLQQQAQAQAHATLTNRVSALPSRPDGTIDLQALLGELQSQGLGGGVEDRGGRQETGKASMALGHVPAPSAPDLSKSSPALAPPSASPATVPGSAQGRGGGGGGVPFQGKSHAGPGKGHERHGAHGSRPALTITLPVRVAAVGTGGAAAGIAPTPMVAKAYAGVAPPLVPEQKRGGKAGGGGKSQGQGQGAK